MRIALLSALMLAGCSVQTAPDNAVAPSPARAATPAPSPVSSAPAATDTAVTPGELKTFGDWAVGCDNTALCAMASLGPDGGLFPEVTMAILRQPGPEGAFDLSFDVPGEGQPVRPVAVEIDGRRLPLGELNGAAATAVVRAIANGKTLAILEGGDRRRATLSLAGASAALRWIDARQGRAGTVTAAVATGPQPATAVPERRPAPVVRALMATGVATAPTPAQLARMRKQAGCEERMADGEVWQPESHALGGGATLVLLPCSAGAYNLSSALFVLKDGKLAPALTDTPTGFGPTPAAGTDRLESVVNGTWKDGELTSYAKGRGLGDCGVTQTMVWDGTRLRLTEQAEMGECRGNPDYITTWRTQVVRG